MTPVSPIWQRRGYGVRVDYWFSERT